MNTKKASTVLRAFLLWLAGLGVCAAQTNSIDSFQVNQEAGRTVVRITTKEPLRSVPATMPYVPASGPSELRRACVQTRRRGGTPRARAA